MVHTKTFLVLLTLCLLPCGCKMVSGVRSSTTAIAANRQAIEESTAGVQAIGQAISNGMPVLEAAQRSIEEAAQGIAAARPAIQTSLVAVQTAQRAIEGATQATVAALPVIHSAMATVEKTSLAIEQSSRGIEANRIAIEASTRSIGENEATVNRSSVALGRIGQVLEDLLGAVDRLTAKKGILAAWIAGGAMLLLVPWVAFLVFLWKFSRAATALAARMDQRPSRPASAFPGGAS